MYKFVKIRYYKFVNNPHLQVCKSKLSLTRSHPFQLLLRAESEPLRTDALVIVQLSDVNDNHPTIEDFDIVFNNRINEYFSGAIGYIPAKG
jgi:hypothetical protein